MKPTQTIRVLLISGSTRPGSSNTLALHAMHELDHPGLVTEMFAGMLDLPAFVPGDAPLPPSVVGLLSSIENADAVVFSTPEYAGGLPGSLKNLLDWTVGGGQLYGKPVAWLDVASPGRGHGARAQLRTVLGYVGARIVERACVRVPLDGSPTGQDISPAQRRSLSVAQAALVATIEEVDDAGTR
jgi:NAD(P)H-dependent FMN reductase